MILKEKAYRTTISIAPQGTPRSDFQVPFMISGVMSELKWFAEQILERIGDRADDGYIVFHIEPDEQRAERLTREEMAREDMILQMADEIRKKRG